MNKQDEKEWDYDLFSCFDDFSLCVCTFCLPCYTLGRNVEHFQENGVLAGVMYGLGLISLGPVTRSRIRQERNIQGTMLIDVLTHMFCSCCALVQENKEIYGSTGSHAGEKIPFAQNIIRE